MVSLISSTAFFVTMGVVFAVFLVAIFIVISGESKRKKKNRPSPEDFQKQKDWQAVSLNLEKHIYSLRQQATALKVQEKKKEREIGNAKAEIKRLQEKIHQERGWHDKEQQDIAKAQKEAAHLKSLLSKAEEDLEKEHKLKLNLEFELKEAKKEITGFHDLRLKLESELAQWKAQMEVARKEVKELKDANSKLSQKHDESDWIAKTEYEKLEETLKQKEIDLEKLRQNLKREML